ncbi:MAG: chlorophyll synthesis pathway protein BchC [Pseudomonadota bacterium]
MDATAVVLEEPQHLRLREVALAPPSDADVVVDISFSGISSGTERLLWTGEMPPFPGMGYPLVPGYESVGVIRAAGPDSGRRAGEVVFVPGARCFQGVNGLFGGAASSLVVSGARVVTLPPSMGEQGVLLALAATAYHALRDRDGQVCPVDLVVGHGVLGRLITRVAIALGYDAPMVWESNANRKASAPYDYAVCCADSDSRRDYRRICDASGKSDLLDTLISRLAPGGEVVLAGFYSEPLSFVFPPAFMREACISVAAQWQPDDLSAVLDLITRDALSLDGLITHRLPADQAHRAYHTAFGDPNCLKMILDWRAEPHGG